jgi:hypothetical protein
MRPSSGCRVWRNRTIDSSESGTVVVVGQASIGSFSCEAMSSAKLEMSKRSCAAMSKVGWQASSWGIPNPPSISKPIQAHTRLLGGHNSS